VYSGLGSFLLKYGGAVFEFWS